MEREHDEKTKVKNIHTIEIGKFEMDTWYYSPYPDVRLPARPVLSLSLSASLAAPSHRAMCIFRHARAHRWKTGSATT